MSTYKERHARRAFDLVKKFVKDKVRQDVIPDMVYRELTTDSRGSYVYKDRDAWTIAIRDKRCIMAVDDTLPTIIVGELKLSRRLFGGDRSSASSYTNWDRYYFLSYTGVSFGMGIDIADAIIEALDPPAA